MNQNYTEQDGSEASFRVPQKSNFVSNCFEWIEALVTSLILVVILFTFIFRIVNVSGPSMLPNLRSRDRVVLSSYFYKPQRGDVVVITHSANFNEPIIKRVIALENQVVDINYLTGYVSVDGKELDESAYIQNGITTQQSDFKFPLTVPKGHVFVLGDNRSVSNDSRFSEIGMIDERYILGKAEYIVFPLSRFGKVK
ncbi:MAG TPA: signal peptidase I [Caproiciproducens sp.]|nr:signal peptidase I [Caproiciproducens sp.]